MAAISVVVVICFFVGADSTVRGIICKYQLASLSEYFTLFVLHLYLWFEMEHMDGWKKKDVGLQWGPPSYSRVPHLDLID